MSRVPHRLPFLLVALGGAVALLIFVIGAGFVLRGSGDGGPPSTGVPGSTLPQVVPAGQTVATLPPTRPGSEPAPLPIIPVQASSPGRSANDLTVDRLDVDAVVQVSAAGFDQFETGFVEQCVTELNRLEACTGRFPVQFGEDGGADFQYLTHSSLLTGGCRYGRATCRIEVAGTASGRTGQAQVVVGEARRGLVRVEPRSGLRDGQVAAVSVSDFPAEARAIAVLCESPGNYDVGRCGAPSTGSFGIGPNGRGRAELTVRTGSLGASGVRCGPRDPCEVLVVTEAGYVAAPGVPLHFSLGPGASYNGARLAVGLSAAALLVVVALVVVRRTDWTKPTEAATPEVDAADLETGKSLDELFGTDEELEERDPILF